jgi:hypothetical protein
MVVQEKKCWTIHQHRLLQNFGEKTVGSFVALFYPEKLIFMEISCGYLLVILIQQ